MWYVVDLLHFLRYPNGCCGRCASGHGYVKMHKIDKMDGDGWLVFNQSTLLIILHLTYFPVY